MWDGEPAPPSLRRRLEREWRRREFLAEQINELERERRRLLRESDDPALGQVRQLMTLRGVGINSAWLFVMEFFSWRDFRNGKEVGSLAVLTPTPHQNGTSHREQGIEKSGNKRVRSMAIEIAWRGSAISRTAGSPGGTSGDSPRLANELGSVASWQWLGSSWWRCGGTWRRESLPREPS